MKKLLIIPMIVLAATGCKKKEQGDTVTAMINGKAFTANSVIAIVSSGNVTIDATSASGESIEIDVQDLTSGTSVYSLDSGNVAGNRGFYQSSSAYPDVISRTGTVTINLTSNNRVFGTFSYTTTDGTVITNGVYNSVIF